MIAFLKRLFGGEPLDISALLDRGAIIIDVRSPQEFSSGHAEGSINIPLGNLGQHLPAFKQQQKPVLTCCKSGIRSEKACRNLKAQGIEAYNAGRWENIQKVVKHA